MESVMMEPPLFQTRKMFDAVAGGTVRQAPDLKNKQSACDAK